MTDADVKKIIKSNPGLGRRELAKAYPHVGEGVFRRALREAALELRVEDMDDKDLAKVQQQKQAAMDQNLHLRKLMREENRVLSIIEKLNEEFHNCFKDLNLPLKIEHRLPTKDSAPVIVVCLSDLHAQETINEIYNVYNFEVLARRLKKYAHKILEHANFIGAKRIDIAQLGDFINNSNHIGELLVNSTTGMKATMQVAILLEQFILELYDRYPVRVYCVHGNESRIRKENDKALISDNYDFAINNLLKAFFKNCDIEFIDGNGIEQVIPVKQFNILAVHGDERGFNQSPAQAVKLKKQQIGATYKCIIDMVIFGHIHSSLISLTDGYARCASMCGTNSYAFASLGFAGGASQNILIVDESITPISIDLQGTDGYVGYELNDNYLGV